jgi:hypothetical protein
VRYIDDVFALDNAHLQTAISTSAENGGLYPEDLVLEQVNVGTPNHGTFIGVDVSLDDRGKIKTKMYDKTKDFPFKVRKYPLMKSLIPSSIPYGVFTGVLYRAQRISSQPRDMIDKAVNAAMISWTNGCSYTRLQSSFYAFIAKHQNQSPHSLALRKQRSWMKKTFTRDFSDQRRNPRDGR